MERLFQTKQDYIHRKIACNTVRFWLYSRVWLGLYFMRPWLLKQLRKLAQSRK